MPHRDILIVMLKSPLRRFFFIILLTIIASLIAMPSQFSIPYSFGEREGVLEFEQPAYQFTLFGKQYQPRFDLKQGLDIQGGTQIVLQADMSGIAPEDQEVAIESVREVIARRVDLFGVSEPLVQTSRAGEEYRIIVELAGIDDPRQALQLIGTTAQLDFRLQGEMPVEATASALAYLDSFVPTDLTGADLERSTIQFDPQTNQPNIALEFNSQGTTKFANITKENVGNVLGIFLDGYPLMLPQINTPILDGQAVVTGAFTLDEAKSISIQLNAGALPVPIQVIEQRTIGATLGQESVRQSVIAGVIGVGLVMVFMILLYGWNGVIASLALIIYSVITIAVFKLIGVTLTLPGIAGLLLSIGMAVDANILIFERMKEELRLGKPFDVAMEQGFGRAWDSIKDANFATLFTAVVLINPLNFSFLNSSGMVKGFGITLFLGVIVSLFTGVVVTRTLMRLFLHPNTSKN